MPLTFTHHRDFLDAGYNPLAGPLGGGLGKRCYKCAMFWKPSLLDGNPQYEFEFTVDNPNASNGTVAFGRSEVWGVTVTELASHTIPAGSGKTTYRIPVTFPDDAFYDQWTEYIAICENGGAITGTGMQLYTARLKITQTNATKTVIWRPLCNASEGAADCYYCQIDLLLTAVDEINFPLNAGVWERLDSDFTAASRDYILEYSINGSGGGISSTTVQRGFYNKTSSTDVVSFTNTPPGFFSTPQFAHEQLTVPTSFGSSGDLYSWFWAQKTPTLLGTGKIHAAGLYIILDGVTKVTTWARVSKGTGTTTGGFSEVAHTARVLADDFTAAASLFTEVSGYMENGSVTGRVQLLDSGASDTATTGTAIPATAVTITGTTQGVFRSASYLPSALPTGSRLLSFSDLASGSAADLHADWVLIAAVWEVLAPSECIAVNASIDSDTLLVTGSGSGDGTEWRVIRLSDDAVMDSGSGSTANFSFTGAYNERYQLQFR